MATTVGGGGGNGGGGISGVSGGGSRLLTRLKHASPCLPVVGLSEKCGTPTRHPFLA
jgi:hypothetical protein